MRYIQSHEGSKNITADPSHPRTQAVPSTPLWKALQATAHQHNHTGAVTPTGHRPDEHLNLPNVVSLCVVSESDQSQIPCVSAKTSKIKMTLRVIYVFLSTENNI